MCRLPITKMPDHFEFKLAVLSSSLMMPARKKEVKTYDFHETCNKEFIEEFNNFIQAKQQEMMRK